MKVNRFKQRMFRYSGFYKIRGRRWIWSSTVISIGIDNKPIINCSFIFNPYG